MSKRAIQRDDLLALKFVGSPSVSPDGTKAVHSVRVIDAEKNKYFSHLWLYNFSSKTSKQFTFGEIEDGHPVWSADSKTIAFLRRKDKNLQIWAVPVDGGEPRQLTQLPEGAITEFDWAPDGKRMVLAFRPRHEAWTQDPINNCLLRRRRCDSLFASGSGTNWLIMQTGCTETEVLSSGC